MKLPSPPVRIARLPKDERGYPLLLEMAQKDGPDAVDELMACADAAMKLLPAA